MSTHDVKEVLTEVYETLEDSRNGYQESAENVKDTMLKNQFQELANKRQRMLDQLRDVFARVGQAVAESGSIKGAFHRMFLDLKSLLTGGSKDAIVKEIERGESYLITTYRKALAESDLPPAVQQTFLQQLREVENDLTNVKRLYAV